MTFNFSEVQGQYGLLLEYCTDLFRMDTIKWMLGHLKWLLEQILRNPDVCLEEIDLCMPEEMTKILQEFNQTQTEYDSEKTIVELFEEQVEKAPEKTAFVFETEQLTYSELNEHANALAHRLRKLGIGTEDYVMIIARRGLEMIQGIYGILKSGAAYVPVDTEYPFERIQYMIEDCRPKAILVYGISIDTEIPVFDLGAKEIWTGNTANPECHTRPENLLYLIYTSGTTGKPKGVMLQNQSVVNYCKAKQFSVMTPAYENGYTRMASVTNLTFDIFVTELLLPMVNGMTTYLTNEEEQRISEAFYQFVVKNGIEILQTTPSRIKLYLMDKRNIAALGQLKLILLGGEKVEAALVNELRQYTDAQIRNVYGPSETTVWSTVRDVSEEDKLDIPVGTPISNTQVYIMKSQRMCGIGEPGELCIAGDGLARGYLNRPDLTKEKFVDNPFGSGRLYHTGDMARWQADGTIFCMGRMDEQVKIRGHRIELGEIESILRTMPQVQDTAVIVRKDSTGEAAIYAYLVSEQELCISDIRTQLGKILPDYMVPAYFLQIERIPVNQNGKLDKRALPEILTRQTDNYAAPTNAMEQMLCEMFSRVLQVEKVGIYDNFFEFGGNSINAVKVVMELHKNEISLSVRDLMLHPVVKDLAEILCMEQHPKTLIVERFYDTEEPDRMLDMQKTKVYQAMEAYQNQIQTAKLETMYEPLRMQKQFWERRQGNICVVHAVVRGCTDKKIVMQAVEHVIREQDVLRSAYNEQTGKISVYQMANWNIPYDEENAEETKRAALVLGLNEELGLFRDQALLSYVFVSKGIDETYHIWFYVHHCIWDGMSDEILIGRLNHYIRNHTPEDLPQTYAAYVTEKQKAAHRDHTERFWETYKQASKKMEEAIRLRNGIQCTVHGQTQISERESEKFKDDPLCQMVKYFVDINVMAELTQIPITILYHGRNAQNQKTLGMFLDILPGIYDIEQSMIEGGNAWITDGRESQYQLFMEQYPELLQLPSIALNYGGVFDGIRQIEAEETNIIQTEQRSSNEIRASVSGNKLDLTLPIVGVSGDNAMQKYDAFIQTK